MSTENKKVTLLSVMPENMRAQIKMEVIAEMEEEKQGNPDDVSPAMKQYLADKKKAQENKH